MQGRVSRDSSCPISPRRRLSCRRVDLRAPPRVLSTAGCVVVGGSLGCPPPGRVVPHSRVCESVRVCSGRGALRLPCVVRPVHGAACHRRVACHLCRRCRVLSPPPPPWPLGLWPAVAGAARARRARCRAVSVGRPASWRGRPGARAPIGAARASGKRASEHAGCRAGSRAVSVRSPASWRGRPGARAPIGAVRVRRKRASEHAGSPARYRAVSVRSPASWRGRPGARARGRIIVLIVGRRQRWRKVRQRTVAHGGGLSAAAVW